jgi:hypothetical protein
MRPKQTLTSRWANDGGSSGMDAFSNRKPAPRKSQYTRCSSRRRTIGRGGEKSASVPRRLCYTISAKSSILRAKGRWRSLGRCLGASSGLVARSGSPTAPGSIRFLDAVQMPEYRGCGSNKHPPPEGEALPVTEGPVGVLPNQRSISRRTGRAIQGRTAADRGFAAD